MKNIISSLFIIILLQSCAQESKTSSTINLMKKAETSLTTPVHIAGDSTWSIEERMEHYGIPGVSIAVINNDKIEWAKGYGVMDKESKSPVTEQTLFQASALSIPVTAYGALRLVEQDRVTLDENINSYLKSWQLPDNEFTKEKKATIRNLLNHSAGINLHATPGYSADSTLPTLIEVLNGTSPAKNEPVLVNKEPDESFYISYTGYGIIQQMMIDIEGKIFPEIMNDLVLQPLEMTNSTFNQSLSQDQIPKAATAYLEDGTMVKGKRFAHPILASRGLWTTAEDLAKFIIHVQQTLKGNRNIGLSKEMTELMVTPYSVSSYGPGSEYGLGFQLLDRKDETYLRHWGWNRGFYAEMVAHRDKEYGVVVMTNSTFPGFNAELIRAVARAYQWDNYVPEHKKKKIEQSLVDKITGRYQANNKTISIYQKDNQLFYKNILDVKAKELIKVSDSIFVRRNSSNLIQFKPNSENGTVNLLFLNRNDKTIASTFVKMDTDQKNPVEFLLEGDFEKALTAYGSLIEQDATHPTVTEDYLNDLGNRFLYEDRIKLSLNTFKLNMMIYPESFKVYDSYANACMKIGEIDLAILNYSKSLELNSQNNNAMDMLKELQSAVSLSTIIAQEDSVIIPEFPPLKNRYLSQKPPGLIPELFAPGIISTEAYLETVVTFLPDMKELSFTRSGGKYEKPTFFVMQNKNNRWNRKSILSTDINEYKERFHPSLLEIKNQKPFKDIPIVGFTISAKGTYYFYVLNFEDGSGHMSYSRLIDGKYETPRKMSKAVNTGKYIAHPFIAPDESYLLWDAEKDGENTPDIYISFRQKDGSWGTAINMGDKINTPLYEQRASVTPDGKYLFFWKGDVKAREDGSRYVVGSPYWVDAQIIENLRTNQ